MKMSSQKRIDQYFKSTSSNTTIIGNAKKQTVKTKLNRSSTGRKLPNNNKRGTSKSLKNSSFVTKITQQSPYSPGEIFTDDSLFQESILIENEVFIEKSANKILTDDRSLSEKSTAIDDSNPTTPQKKTIKGFAMACNSPPSNRSPTKICLKRSNGNSTLIPSPQKRSAIYPEKILDDGKKKIIVTADENISKSSVEELIVPIKQRKIDNFPDHIENDFNTIEKPSNDSNIQINNFVNDNRCDFKQEETNFASEEEKIDESSNSMNLITLKAGWKISVSIETPTRSMTALSTNWRKTLDVSDNNPTKLSCNLAETSSKENIATIKENNADVAENKSTTTKLNEKNCDNASVKKCSPRRSLFSSEIPRKNLHSEKTAVIHSEVTNTSSMSSENDDPLLKNVTKASKEIFISNNFINENLHITETTNEISQLPKKIFETPTTPKKINRNENFPKKITEASIKTGSNENSPTKIVGSSISPPKKLESPEKSFDLLKTPTKKILATPTKSQSFSPRIKYSPQKSYKDRLDTHLMDKAVENLNQAKQGIISENNFDLEFIYAKNNFEIQYGNLKTVTAIKYETRDVCPPREKHADHFFMVLVDVFSEPMNCGYFDENEIDTIFSVLTLTPEAQSLLARMLKRKRGWHRVPNIKYPEIAEDLEPIFKELVRQRFLDDDIENVDLSRSLNLLQADEIRAVCQAMKISHKGTKPTQISDLVKLSNKKKSLFPGMKTPSSALTEKVKSMLGFCIRLPDRIENLLDRIFILLIPTQDPKENMADAFRMLIQVHFGDKIFPTTPKQRFPIFTNRLHLIRYAEARSAWHRIINASEAKHWETVRALGQLAYDQLKPHFENNDRKGATGATTKIPSHVKRFDANYAWIKVMSKSVEGFKKTKESMATAAEFLHVLVGPSNDVPSNRTRWYSELALIESYHRKNFETSAEITIKALMQDKISDIDVAEILERARILAKTKALSADTKERINVAVRLRQEMFISTSQPTIKEITATMVSGNTTGSKSTWSVNIGGSDTGYVRVEDVARRHYLADGFRYCIHCEGALPVTLFATLLWDEIYTIPIPGAFLSSYQTAPLDLYTSRFHENRRERIEEKLKTIRRLDLEHLSNIMQEDFAKYRSYESLMHGDLFEEPEHFKDFIECLGIDGVVGICERLAGNYNQWKSGFPDLALWNPVTKKCKIVEVKGPGDSLSTKQKLWIQFLECLGVEVEVCIVKGSTKKYVT